MKKYIITAVLAAAFVAVLSGVHKYYESNPISNIEYYAEKNNSKLELRILSNWNYINNKGRTYQKLISDFNESHSDVTIQNDYIWDEEYFERLKAEFASENEPDIFISWPGEVVDKFAATGKIADLTPLLKENDQLYGRFDKSLLKYIVADGGSVYGLPIERVFVAVFVNTDVLESVGLRPAGTYEELKNQIAVLNGNGIVPIAADSAKNGLLIYKSIAAALGGKFYSDFVANDEGVNKYYVYAADYMKELYSLGAFPKNMFSLKEKDAEDLFVNKKAAYIVQNSYFTGELKCNENYDMDTLKLVSFPLINGGYASKEHALYGAGMDTLFISRKSYDDFEKREKILEFVDYLISDDTAAVLKESLDALSAFGDIRENSGNDKNMNFIYSRNEIINFPDYSTNSEVWTKVEQNLPNILNGRKDILPILENALGLTR